MKKHGKRYREAEKLIDRSKAYTIEEAIETLQKLPKPKFNETVEINFQLGIDPKANETVRGMVSLPHGTGKTVKVLCFCRGEEAKDAEAQGADYVGADDLVAKIQSGWMDFDVVVAHPDMMRDISKLGRVLGPKGLMPSPKSGTVTKDIGKIVGELKKGKIEYKSDKTAGLHVPCGKVSFKKEALVENIKVIMRAIGSSKPASSKGDYLKSVYVSTSQGPGIRLAAKLGA